MNTRNGAATGSKKATVGQTIMSDLQKVDLHRTLRGDLRDLYNFYLDDESRERVAGMGRVKRCIFASLWFLKGMFLKLTPARRIFLLIALILSVQLNHPANTTAGMLILLLILILELKDKLLAQDELAAGRAIQFALMPDPSPTIRGWDVWLFTRPANDVGGDLVDYLRVQGDRVGLALGDVAGKGFGAALLMARLQSTLRAIAPREESVAALGSQMNRIFCRDAIRSSFASFMYLEVQPDSGIVRILNAGHLPAIAVLKDSLTSMPLGGPALGVLPDTEYFEQQVEIGPGELLIVYSDGITEASNEEAAFFGLQRLMESLAAMRGLSAREVGERLLAKVDEFAGGAKPSDDISLLILRRLNQP